MMTLDEMKKKKKELGYSNHRIADLSGLPFGTVQKIFGGVTTTPRHETLAALEQALNHPRVVYSYDDIRSDSDVVVLREEVPYGTAVNNRLYTIDDYFALPDDVRVELIDGVFYDMAAPNWIHQTILGRLFISFDECIRKHSSNCHAAFAPLDVQLDKDEYTMVQPDLLVICDTKDIVKGRIYGAPKFTAEILSPSTRSKDMFKKLNKYRFAGVEEYWIIDPQNLQVTVYDLKNEMAPDKYGFTDQIPLGISKGKCKIDFSKIYEEVKPFLEEADI